MHGESKAYTGFYEREYHPLVVNPNARPEDHAAYPELKRFIETFNLQDKKVLEIGGGGGQFQNVVQDYTGLDILESLRKFYRKPFVVVRVGERYPFPSAPIELRRSEHRHQTLTGLLLEERPVPLAFQELREYLFLRPQDCLPVRKRRSNRSGRSAHPPRPTTP